MNKLSQSLESKWNTPVRYLKKALLNEDKKWIQKDDFVVFPLYFNFQSAGHIKIFSRLNEKKCQDTYGVIQWTLQSLEDVFKKYQTSFYFDSKDIYPLLVESVTNKNDLKLAYEIYEKSFATSFIHCHAKVFKRDFVSSDLNKTLIFISDISSLSKEDQLFLSHLIRTEAKIPLIMASTQESIQEIQKNLKIIPSLLESFNSFRSY